MTVAAIQAPTGSLASLDAETMQQLIAGGDCSRLTPAQKVAYYQARCEAAGLDPRAQPFAFMRLNGKEVLYAQKAASDQLAAKHGVRMTIVSQATEDGIRVVTVRAEAKDGRMTEEIGALPVKGLAGEPLSNALMKCVTKAKRRAVLSLCGLGMLDETEVESIPAAEIHTQQRGGDADAPFAVPSPPAPTVPPPYVAVLWARAWADWIHEAKGKWDNAVLGIFGFPKPSHTWTPEEARKVEDALWPQDITF
jgi:hypothetical protein